MKIIVVLEQGANNWGAHAPDIEDAVIATGATREETIANFRAALNGLWAFKRQSAQDVPDITEMEIRETVAA